MDISINLLAELDSISKIHTLKRDDIDGMMIEFARRILATFRIERMSVWLFNKDRSAIVSMGEYNLLTHAFAKETVLKKNKFPNYFKAISENEILLIDNVYESELTNELTSEYLQTFDVISLMDIPMRIGGELIGVMCFEKTGTVERRFNKDEQYFALSISIVFASNIEARQRRALQVKLDQELKEKTVLLKEIHHRVKNNLSVVSSLMYLQSSKTKDSFHKNLFIECSNKINSISNIHEIIYNSRSLSEVSTADYFNKLISGLNDFYASQNSTIKIEGKIEDVLLELNVALPLALIVNEVITNSYKHAFEGITAGRILVSFAAISNKAYLQVIDNGVGMHQKNEAAASLGMEIINGLAEQLEGTYAFSTEGGTSFELTFDLKKT